MEIDRNLENFESPCGTPQVYSSTFPAIKKDVYYIIAI